LDINPLGAGLVAHALISALAERMNVKIRIVPQPTPPQAIETLNNGGCDVMMLGIDDARRKDVDFTSPVIQFDYAYLVPSGSPIEESTDVDRPGRRIAMVQGHASWKALKELISHAEIVATDLPDEAFALFRDGGADVFAMPREPLIDYAAMLPGSRILTQGFGINNVGLAVAKGRSQLLAVIGDFVEEAKASGLVGRILDDAKLTPRGFIVAT
jgi:polar amino acid transport system substrate-binding protein